MNRFPAITGRVILLIMLATGFAVTSSLLFSQEQRRDMDRSYFESGMRFMASGQYTQALEDLNIVVESFPQSPFADNALLQIGIYHQDAAGNAEQAVRYFNTIIRRFADSDSAADAYFRKGRLLLEISSGEEGLTDASACFDRVVDFYPDSPAVCSALIHSALAQKRLGKPETALTRLMDSRLIHGMCPAAAFGAWEASMLLLELERPMEAMQHLQRLRDNHPESPEAGKALEVLALLFRMEIRAREDRATLYLPDPSFSVRTTEKWKNPVSIRVLTDGSVLVSDQGREVVYTLDRDGTVRGTAPVSDAGLISLLPDGDVLVGSGNGARLLEGGHISFSVEKDSEQGGQVSGYSKGSWATSMSGNAKSSDENKKSKDKDEDEEDDKDDEDDDGEKSGLKQLEKVAGVVQTRSGVFLVISRERERIEVFPPPTALSSRLGRFKISPIRSVENPITAEVDREGRIFVLSKKERSVLVFDNLGSLITRLGGKKKSQRFEEPVDMAVDAAGNLFVLDGKTKQIIVFSRKFKELFTIDVDGASIGVEMKKPVSVDVGPDGSLYLLDGGTDTVHLLN